MERSFLVYIILARSTPPPFPRKPFFHLQHFKLIGFLLMPICLENYECRWVGNWLQRRGSLSIHLSRWRYFVQVSRPVGSTPSRCSLGNNCSSDVPCIYSHSRVRLPCSYSMPDFTDIYTHSLVSHVTFSRNGGLSSRCRLEL